MSNKSVTVPSTVEEWAEDEGGFFEDFVEEATGNISRRKRNRQACEWDLEQQQAEKEDEVTRKARADEARRKIAAKVLARASPREVHQAIKRAKNENGQLARQEGFVNEKGSGGLPKRQKRQQKRGR